MASISGGAVITYSSTSSFTVDASGSYDLDYPSSSILSFGWTCVTISPSFGAKCLPYFSDKSYSTLNITQGNLGVGQYVVSVYVTNKLGRQASSNVTLIILKGQIPQVWIAPPQAKYNPTDKIILTGTVGATVGTAWAAWNVSSSSLSSSGVVLSSVAMTPLLSRIAIGQTIFQLAIRANVFVAGLTYTFLLGATYSRTYTGTVDG